MNLWLAFAQERFLTQFSRKIASFSYCLNKILNFSELSCIGGSWSIADYQNIL